MCGSNRFGGLLEGDGGVGCPLWMVVGALEDRHHGIADQAIDVAAVTLDGGDRSLEIGIEHARHLLGPARLREGGESLEIGEENGHLGLGSIEIERAEALLVPLAVGAECDYGERDQHQHVPLPPRELPVADTATAVIASASSAKATAKASTKVERRAR